MPGRRIAQRLGVSKTTVHKLINRHGMPMLAIPTRKKSGRESEHEARNRAIAARVAAGASHSKAGAEFGITPQRVSQINARPTWRLTASAIDNEERFSLTGAAHEPP